MRDFFKGLSWFCDGLLAAARNCFFMVVFLAIGFAFLIGAMVYFAAPIFRPAPPPYPYVAGWVDDAEARDATIPRIEKLQGFPVDWRKVFRDNKVADDQPVFFWVYEDKVIGRIQKAWDQKDVGSCVSFGWGRGCNYLMLIQIYTSRNNPGGGEDWPGYDVATEPIYGGSRVEIGGGRISGDGSVGAWAAEYVSKYGLLLRKKYLDGKYDLTTYDTRRCREWGNRGVPDDLEPVAREHPVKGVALVKTAQDVWEAVGNGYPVPICSDVGFQSPLTEGFCRASGQWNHCMIVSGRFMHPAKGKCFTITNSWGNYLKSGDPRLAVVGADGGYVNLPEGTFACTWQEMDRIARQGDSYAISNFKGFPSKKPDWFVFRNQQLRREDRLYAQHLPARTGPAALLRLPVGR